MITMKEATKVLNNEVQKIDETLSVYLDGETIVLNYGKLVYDRVCTYTWGNLDGTFEINKLGTKASLVVAKTNIISKFYDKAKEIETELEKEIANIVL